jgi:glucosamine 6-phosphate synthetase-like amidotransferase/phosphosugar isomerase protein
MCGIVGYIGPRDAAPRLSFPCQMGMLGGTDMDQPRGLAKSVTVE